MVMLSILVAMLPGAVIAYIIWRQDRFDPEPRMHLALSFLAGMLITVPAYLIERWAVLSGWDNPSNMWSLLLTAFVIVSLVEEAFKGGVLLIYPYRQRAFNEPLDGIIYAVMIGMGFATTENIIYAVKHGMATTIIRAFTAVPAHGAFAIILGYYVGLSRFDPARRWKLIGTGFGLAVFLHGIYDLFIVQEMYDWLIGLAIPVLVFSIFLGIRMIRRHQSDSELRFRKIEEDPPPEKVS